MAETKRVRVSYQPTGHGLALMIAAPDADGADSDPNLSAPLSPSTGDVSPNDDAGRYQDGLLHISDACITLELPAPDGRPSVLAWDPCEVDWQSWTEAIPA